MASKRTRIQDLLWISNALSPMRLPRATPRQHLGDRDVETGKRTTTGGAMKYQAICFNCYRCRLGVPGTKRDAEREATGHMAQYGHRVIIGEPERKPTSK